VPFQISKEDEITPLLIQICKEDGITLEASQIWKEGIIIPVSNQICKEDEITLVLI
jgi:hypothetical protein